MWKWRGKCAWLADRRELLCLVFPLDLRLNDVCNVRFGWICVGMIIFMQIIFVISILYQKNNFFIYLNFQKFKTF